MKYLFISILCFSVLAGTVFGQSDELAAMTSELQAATGTVQTAAIRYESKISFIEPAGIRYSFDEIDRRGKKTNHVYEFNVADIDPYAIREQTQRDVIYVILAVKNKQKLVKVYKNFEIQPYQDQVSFYARDIESAKQIGDIVRKGIPAAEKVMAGRLNLAGYNDMLDWLSKNVNNVALGRISYTQTLAGAGMPGSLRFTKITEDGRTSAEETFTFNLADINPYSISFNIAGNQFGINFETLQKAKHISMRRNAEARPFVNAITINTNNVDEARDLKTVLTMLIPLAGEQVNAGMPAINSDSNAVALISSLTTDITFGPRQISQTIEPRCMAEMTQVERDPRITEKNDFRFNWMDVNPNASLINTAGERLFINIRIADGKKLIMSSKNNKFSGYDNSVRLYMPDIESARRAKFAIDKAIEKCKAAYRAPFDDNSISAISWLVNNIKDVSVEEVTIAQKLESVEQGNVNKLKLTKRESNPRGTGSEDVFEFNLSDINPMSIDVAARGRWLYVVMVTEFNGRVIKVYRNGKILPYANRIEFAVNDADISRNVINALKDAAKAQRPGGAGGGGKAEPVEELVATEAESNRTGHTETPAELSPSPSAENAASADESMEPRETEPQRGDSAAVMYDTESYTVYIGAIGKNESGKTSVELLGDKIGGPLPVRDRIVAPPVAVKIVVNGETLEFSGLNNASSAGLVFYFDTTAAPEKIIVFGNDGSDNSSVVFDGKTRRLETGPSDEEKLTASPEATFLNIPEPVAPVNIPENTPEPTAPVNAPEPTTSVNAPEPVTPAQKTEPPASTPSAKQYDAQKGAHDVVDLIENKIVEVEIQGRNITNVNMRIRRLVDYPVTVLVPVGSFFVSSNPSAQNMVATAENRTTLNSGDWRTISVSAACANRPKDIPGSNDRFTVLRSPQQKELAALMPVLDKANADMPVKQAAVWIVTDNASYGDLGILISSPGNARVIGHEAAARAIRICSDAGIDITSKRIWNDRQNILNNLPAGELKTWLQTIEK